jgi:glutamine synthetase
VLALGLAGVERGLKLPPEITVDPASLPKDEVGAARLPRNLGDALDHFRASEVLSEAMGPALFETIVAVRETEIAQFADASDDEIVAARRFRRFVACQTPSGG